MARGAGVLFYRLDPFMPEERGLQRWGPISENPLASCFPQRAPDLRGSGVAPVLVEKIWGASPLHKAGPCGPWPGWLLGRGRCGLPARPWLAQSAAAAEATSGAFAWGGGAAEAPAPGPCVCGTAALADLPVLASYFGRGRALPGFLSLGCTLDHLESLPSGVLG